MQEMAFDEKVCELKKIISILEWDINQIQNSRLKTLKEEKLRQFKRELKDLLEKYYRY